MRAKLLEAVMPYVDLQIGVIDEPRERSMCNLARVMTERMKKMISRVM
jgi:hypothetical protein